MGSIINKEWVIANKNFGLNVGTQKLKINCVHRTVQHTFEYLLTNPTEDPKKPK